MKRQLFIAYLIGWMLYGAVAGDSFFDHNGFLGVFMGLSMPGILLASFFPHAPQFLVIYGASAVFWIVLLSPSKGRPRVVAVSPASPTVVRTAWRRRTRTFTEN